jgi:hypothetical protein
MVQSWLTKLTKQPPKLFLLDGSGALLTLCCLLGLLLPLEAYFGMPRQTVLLLAALAGTFAVYSLSCYRFSGTNWRPYLVVIASANTLYCALTSFWMVVNASRLTILGLVYFSLEIAVILCLVAIELTAIWLGKPANTRGQQRT